MKFSLAALALLATSAIAAPSSRSRLEERLAQRAAGLRRTQPLQRVGSTVEPANPDSVESPTATETQYSSNWAGVVIENPPAGTFTAVSATFTVPKPTHASGSSGTQSASAWVGIDGDTAGNSILQTVRIPILLINPNAYINNRVSTFLHQAEVVFLMMPGMNGIQTMPMIFLVSPLLLVTPYRYRLSPQERTAELQ